MKCLESPSLTLIQGIQKLEEIETFENLEKLKLGSDGLFREM